MHIYLAQIHTYILVLDFGVNHACHKGVWLSFMLKNERWRLECLIWHWGS